MSIQGVGTGRFIAGVIGAELAPILMLVLAMFIVGTSMGGRPSQETAERYGAWIGPIGGAIATALIACLLARRAARPIPFGLIFGASVALLDIALILSQRPPFRVVFVVSALSRVAGGVAGAWMYSRSASPES
jgi:hypothetical protein